MDGVDFFTPLVAKQHVDPERDFDGGSDDEGSLFADHDDFKGSPIAFENVEDVQVERSETIRHPSPFRDVPPRPPSRTSSRSSLKKKVLHNDPARREHEKEIADAVKSFREYSRRQEMVSVDGETDDVEKAELLSKIQRLKNAGIPCHHEMGPSTSLDDIRYECYRMTREAKNASSLKTMRHLLVSFAGMIELGNTKYDPFSLNLEGFGNSIYHTVGDYDDSLLALHEKYTGRGAKLPPELSLTFSLCSAGLSHHVSQTVQKNSEGGRGSSLGALASGDAARGMPSIFKMMGAFGGNKPTVPPPETRVPMRGPVDSDDEEVRS